MKHEVKRLCEQAQDFESFGKFFKFVSSREKDQSKKERHLMLGLICEQMNEVCVEPARFVEESASGGKKP